MDEIDLNSFHDALAQHMVGKTIKAIEDDCEIFEIEFTDGTAISLPSVLAYFLHSEIRVHRWDYPEDKQPVLTAIFPPSKSNEKRPSRE